MKSPICYYLTMFAWSVNTLVLLDVGVGALGRNFLMSSNVVQQNFQAFQYLVLATALWNLYLFVMNLTGKKGCSERGCKF